MAYKNPTDFLIDATKYPARVEALLPAGAPKISTTLADAATRLPKAPDFPVEVPALPDPPELPAAPNGLRRLRGPFVGAGVTSVPTATERLNARVQREVIASPHTGTLPEVISRRGM